MKHTVIVSGGNIDRDFAFDFFKRETYDCLIGVDRGIDFLREADLIPDHIVGDFDSAAENSLRFYRQNSTVDIRVYQPEKDNTDTEIALRLALDEESGKVTILGATGTRLDHVAANIRILAQAAERGVHCEILDKNNRIFLIKSGVRLSRAQQHGKYVSLFAIGGNVEGLTLKGFHYPLEDYTLRPFDALAVSNEIEAEYGKITFASGMLLVMETCD